MEMEDRLRIQRQMSVYADKHDIINMMQSLVTNLLIDRPEDPITYLVLLLQRSSLNVPRVLLLGPPSVGKHTVAEKLSAELDAVHVTSDSLLDGQSELSLQELPVEQLVGLIHQRLNQTDCFNKGWVLEGIPRTRLQALNLQKAGVLPQHVVMLDAPVDVLLERNRGKLVDPETGCVYHQTFMWPEDDAVAQRLQKQQRRSEEQLLAGLQRYQCEVTGLTSAYQHVLKVINSDQPPAHIYQQALAFVRTQCYSRTPRILLLGPTGSGKSHQARLLSEKYKMVDVCCGELLRSVAADGSPLGQEVQPFLDEGRPVPDQLVLKVLDDRLSRVDCSRRGWILHGFPQNQQQARILKESQHQANRFFLLELTDDVCLERISLRATDPVSGERFHAVTRPAPNSEVQNRLQTRPEDSIQSVTERLGQYRTESAALQSVYTDAVHVDADQDPHSVFEALESRLAAN